MPPARENFVLLLQSVEIKGHGCCGLSNTGQQQTPVCSVEVVE